MGKMSRLLRGVVCLTTLVLCMKWSATVVMAEENSGKKCGLLEGTFVYDETLNYSNARSMYVPSEEERRYWTSFGSDFYYNQLSDEKKKIWDDLEESCIAIAAGDEYADSAGVGFDNSVVSMDMSELQSFLWMFKYSNPQYYFLMSEIAWSKSGDYYQVGVLLYPEFWDGEQRKISTEAFCTKVDEWVELVGNAGREEQKVKRAHDIIAENTHYNFENIGDYINQSAYSMVCNGSTVCAGYAATLQLLLNPNGIETAEVTSEGHGWNLVKVHEQWYIVDVTWDDTDSESEGYDPVIYKYYLKSEPTAQADNVDHYPEDRWDGYLPELGYDSTTSEYEYKSSYFEQGGYTYFKVNDNAALAELCVSLVDVREGMSAELSPSTVNYDGSSYRVLGIQDEPKEDEPKEDEPKEDEPKEKSDAEVSGARVRLVEESRERIRAYMEYGLTKLADVEFSWYAAVATDDDSSEYSLVQDWKKNDSCLDWTPEFGEYNLKCVVRVVGNESSTAEDIISVSFHPVIKDECQMPYYMVGGGDGYLIGVETYENPNQSYRYEMLILDCTLYAEGKDAWTYTTGQYSVDEGCAGWTVWQPEYGYYWTLFRVFDENGNMLDQVCYGFVNT